MAKKKWTPNKLPDTYMIPIVDLDKTGTQVRAANCEETISSYADSIKEGAALPPVEVVWDGENPILADGFHRTEATLRAGFETIQANVRQGSRRDAILMALQSNRNHGLRFTNADKRKIVGMFLDDEEWSGLSDSEIARHVGCGHSLVSKMKSERASFHGGKIETAKQVTRNGKTYEMKTENIGKKPAEKPTDITSETKPEKELPPDQESRFDYVGQEIPAHLEKSFSLADRFSCLVDTISEAKSEAKSIAGLPGGEILSARMSQVQSQTSEIYRAIKEAEPFAVCLKCGGDLKKATTSCQPCKGLGWITREQFDRFPESTRKSVPKPPKERK